MALTVVLCPQQETDMCTTHRMGQDRHCQQFDTTQTLINAPQWPHRPCNASIQLYRVGKKLSEKADLAMYSQSVDVFRKWMSISLILGCKLDFCSCAIRVGFHKSSHKYDLYKLINVLWSKYWKVLWITASILLALLITAVVWSWNFNWLSFSIPRSFTILQDAIAFPLINQEVDLSVTNYTY